MEVQHGFIIHLIDMVSGEDQNIIGIIGFHVTHVLIDRIGGTGIPVGVFDALIGRKHHDTAVIAVKVPRHADPDMGIQPERLILSQHTHRVNTGIDAVA